MSDSRGRGRVRVLLRHYTMSNRESQPGADSVTELIESVQGSDGYPLHVRLTRAPRPKASLLMLHGMVSHGGWLRPLAQGLARNGVTTICPDRRGAGLNGIARGDAPDESLLLDDVSRVAESCAGSIADLHLCGVCWGGIYAVRLLAESVLPVRSLILLAPGIYPALAPRTEAVAGAPVVDAGIPLDAFTRGPAYRDFILPDPLRLTGITPGFQTISNRMLRAAQRDLLRIRTPTLLVLAEDDRITDNQATRRIFDVMRAAPKQLAVVAGDHGLQFDSPEQVISHVTAWLAAVDRRSAPAHGGNPGPKGQA